MIDNSGDNFWSFATFCTIVFMLFVFAFSDLKCVVYIDGQKHMVKVVNEKYKEAE